MQFLDWLRLAVVQAVHQTKLKEHQQVRETHPRYADQHFGGVVAELKPGEWCALQQLADGEPHQGDL